MSEALICAGGIAVVVERLDEGRAETNIGISPVTKNQNGGYACRLWFILRPKRRGRAQGKS